MKLSRKYMCTVALCVIPTVWMLLLFGMRNSDISKTPKQTTLAESEKYVETKKKYIVIKPIPLTARTTTSTMKQDELVKPTRATTTTTTTKKDIVLKPTSATTLTTKKQIITTPTIYNMSLRFPLADKRSAVYEFIIKPSGICKNKQVTLLICVNVARNRVDKRKSIRETWGAYGTTKEFTTALAFILGSPKANENPKVQAEISKEAKAYGDIVQGRFIDDYHNVTLKVLTLLEYVKDACPHSEYIIKTDDDVYVNIPLLISTLRQKSKQTGNQFVIGNRHSSVTVVRAKGSKWSVPYHEFNGTHFPDHLGGFSYAMPTNVAINISKISPSLGFLWLEDVFITGVCTKYLNVTVLDDKRFHWKRPVNVTGEFFAKEISRSEISVLEQHKVHSELVNLMA